MGWVVQRAHAGRGRMHARSLPIMIHAFALLIGRLAAMRARTAAVAIEGAFA
jgi:hypothetical protein